MDEDTYYAFYIKFCPECCRRLEVSPISSELSCFLHGEFIIREGHLIWRYTQNLIKRNTHE